MPIIVALCTVVRYTIVCMKTTKLEEVIKAKGLKKNWIANQLAVRPETVGRWCKGKTVPNVKKKALSKVLGTSIEQLFISQYIDSS